MRNHPRTAALALLGGSAITVVALLATRPRLPAGPGAWSGDDLALALIWGVAVACSVWLTLTTAACLAALGHHKVRVARRIAGWAPPLARRILQTALAGTWVVVPAAAHATPATVPIDVPVVRAPASTSATTMAPTTVPHATTTVPRAPTPPTPRVDPPARARRVYIVRAGDNLWRIARTEVARSSGVPRPADTDVAPYWRRVVAANRATLRSRDPSLIFPGEAVTLPPS